MPKNYVVRDKVNYPKEFAPTDETREVLRKHSRKNFSLDTYLDLPNPGLKTYFGRTWYGNSDEYRTTFYKHKKPSEVAKSWETHLASIRDKFPELFAYENDQATKIGPMSIQLPLQARYNDIAHYYDDILKPSQPIPKRALDAVVSEYAAVKGTNLRSQESTWQHMEKSKSSGAPFFTKKSRVVEKTLPSSVFFDGWGRTSQITMLQGPEGAEWKATAILGWRGQSGGESKEDVKQRVIWMFPFAVSVAELQAYQPLIEQMQYHELVAPWISSDAVDLNITRMFDTKNPDDLVVCTDFSKFDQHFNQDMANGASYIISKLLAPNPFTREWLSEVFPVKYHIPLLLDADQLLVGVHGMASGSGGTNFDETMTHRALQYEAAQGAGSRLNINSMCLGDDGVLTYPGITVEHVMQTYTSHGQEMNSSKQYVSTHDCIFLRKWHDTNYRVDGICVGVYPTMRAINSLCEQEKYYNPEVWSEKMVALRQLSIIENCKYHPLFEEFVEFCMKGDKYRLGLDIPGFLDDLPKLAQVATDLMPDFLGYTRSLQGEADRGITNWRVVKFLRAYKG